LIVRIVHSVYIQAIVEVFWLETPRISVIGLSLCENSPFGYEIPALLVLISDEMSEGERINIILWIECLRIISDD